MPTRVRQNPSADGSFLFVRGANQTGRSREAFLANTNVGDPGMCLGLVNNSFGVGSEGVYPL